MLILPSGTVVEVAESLYTADMSGIKLSGVIWHDLACDILSNPAVSIRAVLTNPNMAAGLDADDVEALLLYIFRRNFALKYHEIQN